MADHPTGKKLTPKQYGFCRIMAKGIGNQSQAYVKAFGIEADSKGRMPRWITVEASKLCNRDDIVHTIERLRGDIEAREAVSTLSRGQYVIDRLLALVEAKDTPPAVVVRSLELLGKSTALFTDSVQIEQKERSPDQIREALRAKLKLIVNDGVVIAD
jgi:hypothetical protein